MAYRFKVVIGIRAGEDQPWEYGPEAVGAFNELARAIRFAKSEIKDGWCKERVRIYEGRRYVWPG